ncbi:MAG: polyprenyl synthetase family protein [bacterium]
MNIETYLEEKRIHIDHWLDQHLPPENLSPSSIHRAMRYSLLARSKRIRPILSLAVAELLQGNIEWVFPFACALELIHTYSLIHDDLPAMDNDDFRRGQPSNHKVFGEGVAILAGDALLTHAFSLMSSPQTVASIPSHIALPAIYEVSQAAGTQGMIGGQIMDLESEGHTVTLSHVETMHAWKTGAMVSAAIRVGALISGASDAHMENLSRYGRHIGLAFQIVDDLLDVEGHPELLGKTVGKDFSARKATFPSVLGIEESKNYTRYQYEQAIQALEEFGDQAEILRSLAHFIVFRRS